jgi:hypothetical protein
VKFSLHLFKKQSVMARKSYFFVLLILFSGLFFSTSCKKKKLEKEKDEVQEHVQSGTWRITTFNDSGQNEVAHFNGYTFTFEPSGVLVATNGTNTYSGTWSVTTSNSNDDDDNSDLDFNIAFNATNEFEDLSDDWDIQNHSSTKIELIDVSGGNGGTDYLTFEKN